MRHPLEPLSSEEISLAVQIIKKSSDLSARIRFECVVLKEPTKSELSSGQTPNRLAFSRIIDNEKETAFEIIVDLTKNQIHSLQEIPGAQPRIILEEFELCEKLVKEHPDFQEAIKRRGLELDKVMVDPWGCGHYKQADEENKRTARIFCWYKVSEYDNGYARPIDGIDGLVDLHKQVVIKITDLETIPLPPEDGNFSKHHIKDFRKDLKPLEIVQPEGPSFKADGYHVEWQKWDIRFSLNPREGLVLHTVGYNDQGTLRSILHRASMAEIVVPYGEPRGAHYRKNAFDIGEYGMGMLVNSLKLGCDCLGHIQYFDAHLVKSDGSVNTIENAICMHEEDYGILWKHTDRRTDEVEVRRSRRLVISFIATVDNYDYGFYWYFYQDGTIQYEVKLTGILNTATLPPGVEAKYGTLVAPQLDCQVHQHFFTMRLDFDLDGTSNSVQETNFEALPSDSNNPYGNAFHAVTTILKTESEAQRTTNASSDRYWKIINPQRLNKMQKPVGFKIIAHEHALPYAHEDSSVMTRAPFLKKHLWVTPFHENEFWPAGDYPNQHIGGEGLTKWTKQNRSIENTDIVVWYNFGKTHLPRLEDWPVMPVEYTGFTLKPNGFFDQNPALDVPPAVSNNSKKCCH